MRQWTKYIVTDDLEEPRCQSISATFEEHEKDSGGAYGTGGFHETDYYRSKESFFEAYFFGDFSRRIQNYDRFISKIVTRDQDILGLGSGRSANELMLLERGFKVTCSDLAQPGSYRAAKRLFPQMEQVNLDILSGPAEKRYDVILCLSLIYLFNDQELSRFFANVHASLKDGGHLILDSAGPPDNFLSYCINEVYLKHEAKLVRLFRMLKYKRPHAIVTKHHGYRRTDREIIEVTKAGGFDMVSRENYDFITEFERSRVLTRMMHGAPPLERALGLLGRAIPYTRMFHLQKG